MELTKKQTREEKEVLHYMRNLILISRKINDDGDICLDYKCVQGSGVFRVKVHKNGKTSTCYL